METQQLTMLAEDAPPPVLPFERKADYEQYARETYGFSKDWHVFRWEAKGADDNKFIVVTGAVVYERFKRGKHVGNLVWKSRLRETEVPVSFRDDAFRAWILKWEAETGKCSKCNGSGQEFSGWSKQDGVKTRDCTRCKTTGAAP